MLRRKYSNWHYVRRIGSQIWQGARPSGNVLAIHESARDKLTARLAGEP